MDFQGGSATSHVLLQHFPLHSEVSILQTIGAVKCRGVKLGLHAVHTVIRISFRTPKEHSLGDKEE